MIEKLIEEAREQATWDIPENTQQLLLKMADVLEKQMPKKPTTNYEHIKAMMVDEMAEFLENTNPKTGIILGGELIVRYRDYIKLWLESEVQEDD